MCSIWRPFMAAVFPLFNQDVITDQERHKRSAICLLIWVIFFSVALIITMLEWQGTWLRANAVDCWDWNATVNEMDLLDRETKGRDCSESGTDMKSLWMIRYGRSVAVAPARVRWFQATNLKLITSYFLSWEPARQTSYFTLHFLLFSLSLPLCSTQGNYGSD